jgi:hypothetical protein
MMPSASELLAFLQRFHAALQAGQVTLSEKAEDESEEMGWSEENVWQELTFLQSHHFSHCELAKRHHSWWIWIFRPSIEEGTLWIRITEQPHFIIISFHFAKGNP